MRAQGVIELFSLLQRDAVSCIVISHDASAGNAGREAIHPGRPHEDVLARTDEKHGHRQLPKTRLRAMPLYRQELACNGAKRRLREEALTHRAIEHLTVDLVEMVLGVE